MCEHKPHKWIIHHDNVIVCLFCNEQYSILIRNHLCPNHTELANSKPNLNERDDEIAQENELRNAEFAYEQSLLEPPQLNHDPVNHPKHYTSHPSGVECIDITRHMSFNIGNAIKYLWRAGQKDGEDAVTALEKARFYIEDQIKLIRGEHKRYK